MVGKMNGRTKSSQGWRRGGSNAPRWLQAPCVPEIKQRTREDLDLLSDVFQVERLHRAHPFRKLWACEGDQRTLAETRFEMHHIAADLRVVRDVPGGRQLIRTLIDDMEGYDDFRYELRMAAAVGRSAGQRLLGVGGTAKGPDIEVETRSGHRCGIACYRGRTWTPLIVEQSPETTRTLAERFGQIVAAKPLAVPVRIVMAIEVERFPIEPQVAQNAEAAFADVWCRPAGDPRARRDGVLVSRESATLPSLPVAWEVSVVFRMPVPSREKFRFAGHLRRKLDHEQRQWAGGYPGVPVMFAEEPDFCLGLEASTVNDMLRPSAEHGFEGILTTWQFFGDGTTRGSRFRVEQADWHSRTPGVGINIGIETFGENVQSLGDGHLVGDFHPNNAEEEWQLRPDRRSGLAILRCVRRLQLARRIHRMPLPSDGREITAAALEPFVGKLVPNVRP